MYLSKINRQSIGISSFTSVLSNYSGMPTELYTIGKLPENRPPSVAIIGSRRPTDYGKEITYRLAHDLAKQGVIIISGLAYGIDAIAHKAALDAGGTTIAIMANGLHRVYPASHADLAKQIIKQGGALISEQEPGIDAHKYHFLARNRIVSGLADAVIVTEATDRSGTFSTVAHALTQNKEVFAVPGPITSLVSAGPNRLLQEGAHVLITADDVLRIIAPHLLERRPSPTLGDTPLEQTIIGLLGQGGLVIDSLIQQVPATTEEALQTLTIMELKGMIKTEAGRVYLLS